MGGSKHWCLTLNNWSEDELKQWREFGEKGVEIDYFVYGQEVGESGTPHLQGFVTFKRRRTLRGVKRFLGDRVHAESAKGKPCQAAEYCKKDGVYEEFGECPVGQGHRSDLSSAVAAIKNGACRRVLIEEHQAAYARAPRLIGDALTIFGAKRSWMPETVVYYGATGTGKTRRAYEESENPYIHSGGMWFDGYDGNECVIFDDFGGSEFKLTYLLKILDRYPMRVPVKGSFVNWVPKKIWITSNYSPKEWFSQAKDEHVKALFRRFAKVVRFRRMEECYRPGYDGEEEIVIE